MRYALLTILLTALAPTAQAQSSFTATATISARVTEALGIVVDRHLDFGEIAPGTTNAAAVTSPSAPTFTITGEPAKNVTFTLTGPDELTDNTGNTLSFTSDVQYGEDNTPDTANPVCDSDTIALDGASGKAYVFLGGTVTSAGSQVVGTYAGTFTIQVDY